MHRDLGRHPPRFEGPPKPLLGNQGAEGAPARPWRAGSARALARARSPSTSLDTTRTSCNQPSTARRSGHADGGRVAGPRGADPEWVYTFREAVATELSGDWPERATALLACGSDAVLMTCGSCGAPTYVPCRCGARTCPTCAWLAAAKIADRMAARVRVHDKLMQEQPWDGPGPAVRRSWKHVVLTRRAAADRRSRFNPETLQALVRDTRTAVTGFWRRTAWGRQVRDPGVRKQRARRDTSYVCAVEVAPGGMVHVHTLVYGEYIPQRQLQEIWTRVLGESLAIVNIQNVKENGSEGVAATLREVLKYATKGEKGVRDQACHAAAVELAFRHVHRVSIGGALRGVKDGTSDLGTEDVRSEDLYDTHAAACEACGTVGEWLRVGFVSREAVARNGGFGLVRGPMTPVLAGGP